MAIHEIKKCSKIVDEVVMYLLKQGCNDISFKIQKDKKETKIIVTITDLDCDIIDNLKETIGCERSYECEEYGWELMGESDTSEELRLVGMLIDDIEVNTRDDKTTFTLHRIH